MVRWHRLKHIFEIMVGLMNSLFNIVIKKLLFGDSLGGVICRRYGLVGGWCHYFLYHPLFEWRRIELIPLVVDQAIGCLCVL